MFMSPTEQALADLSKAVHRVAALLRASGKHRRALIVAADPALRVRAARAASACGFAPAEISSGREAIITAAGQNFDLLMLAADAEIDRHVRRLRALPGALGQGAIIVLNTPEDAALREALCDAGADAFIPAPCKETQMVALIEMLCGNGDGAADELSPSDFNPDDRTRSSSAG